VIGEIGPDFGRIAATDCASALKKKRKKSQPVWIKH
jgi:hypothetical protein